MFQTPNQLQFGTEHGRLWYLWWVFPLNMEMFHSSVDFEIADLPRDLPIENDGSFHSEIWLFTREYLSFTMRKKHANLPYIPCQSIYHEIYSVAN